MAAATITQFGEWVFANDGWSCKVGWAEARTQFTTTPVITPRAGSHPKISQGAISERTIQATFAYAVNGPLPIQQALQTLLGRLDPRELSPRRLIATAFDGTTIERHATVTMADGWDVDQSVNTVYVTFLSDRPEWTAVAPSALGPFELSNVGQQFAGVAVPNAGYASVEPTITLTPGAFSHLATNATVGWRYRRTIPFTNSAPRTWVNRPLFLDLGATDALVTAGKLLASGDDLRILLLGESLPRTLIAPNYGKTYAVIVPPAIAPGESVSFEIVYGNPSSGAPPVLEGALHPSIIYEYDTGAATAGSTTTKLNDVSKAWGLADRYWVGGSVEFVGGALAGVVAEVTGQTTTSLSFAALPSAPAAGQAYLVRHSGNGRWWYNVNEYFQSTSTPVRGRWRLNSKIKRPRVIDFSAAAAWTLFAMADNSDRFAQTSWSWLDKGGGSRPYAELDAYRSWQGGGDKGQLTREDGQADGVVLNSCLPILRINSKLNLANNLNGMCQYVLMARASGAESWETIDSRTANGPFSSAATLPADDQYYSVYQGLIPSDDEGVIRLDRARDAGSTSADGNTRTSVTDASVTPQLLRKGPSASFPAVQDPTPADITVSNSRVVERDGRRSGSWRGVIHTSLGGDEYKGWLPLSYLSGTDSGGTTLVDGSKNWVPGELVGATVKITGSPNKTLNGKTGTVLSNTATTITLTTGLNATIAQGTAYEVRQPKTTVRLTDDLYCWVDFDTSLISLGAISAEAPVYQVAAEIAVGIPSEINGRKVAARVGLDGIMLFLEAGEALTLDGPTRTARIVQAATGAVKRPLTDPAVRLQQTQRDYARSSVVVTKAARWLPLAMGTNGLVNGDAEGSSLSPWVQSASAAGVTAAASQDASLKYAGAKSFKVAITASTAAAGDERAILTFPPIAVLPRELIYIPAWVRTDNPALQPYLGIRWLQGATVLGSTYVNSAFAPPANAWLPIAVAGIVYDAAAALQLPLIGSPAKASPPGCDGFVLYLAVRSSAANATGSVWFDEIDRGSPVLTVTEVGMNKLNVGVSYAAAYL